MATPPGLTRDGYEVQFGTNHLGHALLIRKLPPVLKSTAALQPGADARVHAMIIRHSPSHDIGHAGQGLQSTTCYQGLQPTKEFNSDHLTDSLGATKPTKDFKAPTCPV
ncbi:hypothetical protein BDW66DRAFT_152377 [Aspergillus desertorum]